MPTGVGLPGENPGIVPPPSQWSGSSLATMSFGQGVSVTPLAMARYYCAIANGGLLHAAAHRARRSTISRAISCSATAPRVVRRVFSQRTAAELRDVLARRRPARHRRSDRTDSRLCDRRQDRHRADGRRRRYRPGYYAASFIGMVPYPHARYLIYVKVERPIGSYYGSVVAAPAFAAIARAAMLHAGVLPNIAAASWPLSGTSR